MGPKLRTLALFAIALVPSAYLAWTWRAMPQLGFYHDDTLYWVSAKSIAIDGTYRIPSLPQQPFQTKYPPVFPALLSLVWKLAPAFPSNLPWATLLVWLIFPAYLFLVRRLFLQFGFKQAEVWILTFAAALNPMAVMLSISLMPELLFMAFFLGCLILAERALDDASPTWFAAAAGLLGGLAYLTKSVALPVLVTAPLCFLFRKQFKRAFLFAAALLPAVAAWQIWVTTHVSRAHDLVTLYYTNYFGFQLYNVGFDNLPRVIWYNLDAFISSAGKLLTFDMALGESKILERVVAVAAIVGVVRLARRSRLLQYPIAALSITGILLVWHYQPDQRFVFPLYPLLAAGLWTELKNFAFTLRQSWDKHVTGDRIAAGVGAAAVLALAALIVYTHLAGDAVFLPRLLAAYRGASQKRVSTYTWISEHTPAGATVFAYDDPLVYLYTGHRAAGLPIPPRYYYEDGESSLHHLVTTLPNFTREQKLDYLLLSQDDFYRDLHEKAAALEVRTVSKSPGLERCFEDRGLSIFRRTR